MTAWLYSGFTLLLCVMSASGAYGSPTTIDFEGLDDSAVLTDSYTNVVFSNTMVLTSMITLNEAEFPPRSGVNVAS